MNHHTSTTMVDPITITIISLVVSGVMIIAASLAIIRNGFDITDKIAEWYRNKKYYHLVLNKTTSLVLFVAACDLLNENKKRIKCNHWQIITVTDASGKNKNFQIPSAGRFIELHFSKNIKVILFSIGYTSPINDVTGFKIYFSKKEDIGTFINLAFKKYLSPNDLRDLITYHEVNNEPNEYDYIKLHDN